MNNNNVETLLSFVRHALVSSPSISIVEFVLSSVMRKGNGDNFREPASDSGCSTPKYPENAIKNKFKIILMLWVESLVWSLFLME